MVCRIAAWLTTARWQLQSERGQAMAEYGLILALIAVVALAAVTGIGTGVRDKLQQIANAL